jgi:hypothetical protein
MMTEDDARSMFPRSFALGYAAAARAAREAAEFAADGREDDYAAGAAHIATVLSEAQDG